MSKFPPKTTSPIKDTNGDGTLDSKELLAQLRAEDVGGIECRSAKERIHGILEFAGAEEVNAMRNKIAGYGPVDKEDLRRLAADLTGHLNAALIHIEEGFATDKQFDKTLEAGIKNKHLPKYKEAIELAAMKNFVAFAQDFHKTFPEGISLKGEDIAAILERFGGSVPTPPPKKVDPAVRFASTRTR